MTDHGYSAEDDPYCYRGTNCLKNKAGIREVDRLEAFEHEMVSVRGEEPLPRGGFTPAHYMRVHRHLFQDVYSWAGRPRTVRISKGGNSFCFPEHIGTQLELLFRSLSGPGFQKGAEFEEFVDALSSFIEGLNAVHAFREGNGRAQLAFTFLLSRHAEHPLDLARIQPEHFLRAMIASFGGDLVPLRRELTQLRI